MARLRFGRLTDPWKGEASDFTPLLVEQLDAVGAPIGVDLTEIGESEVPTTGGRRIDNVAQDEAGSEFVIENQYGRADHDHLTRGLAYAVARRARGLVVIAEEHRDEFRAVAQYLNELAEHETERGIAVWLVEAKAVRIEHSAWAPLFTAVVEPNAFTANVEQAKQEERLPTLEEFWAQFQDLDVQAAAKAVVTRWLEAGYRQRLGPITLFFTPRAPRSATLAQSSPSTPTVASWSRSVRTQGKTATSLSKRSPLRNSEPRLMPFSGSTAPKSSLVRCPGG